jgi:hypothetical protein
MHKLNVVFTWLTLMVVCPAQAFQADDDRNNIRQVQLDQACEAARTVKLAPLRQQAFMQCMNADRSTDTAEDCRRKTAGANLNIQGGGTRFYDLPACVEAFKFRKAHPHKS